MWVVETLYPQIYTDCVLLRTGGGSNIPIVENLMSAEVVRVRMALQRGGTNVSHRETRG